MAIKEGSSLYKIIYIFAPFMTMREKQILARQPWESNNNKQ